MIRSKQGAFIGVAVVLVIALSTNANGQTPAEQGDALGPILPFKVEGYYKIKWGHYEEFMRLFKKNHWPVLQEGIKSGAILEVSTTSPRFHASEDSRWDLRVTIVWRNAIVAASDSKNELNAILQRLFPNLEEFEREETRRFELIEEHTDVPVVAHDTAEW